MDEAGRAHEYLLLRPGSVPDGIRLYAAFGFAAIARPLLGRRFRGLGPFVVGRAPLTVRRGALRFRARPRSEDLLYVLPGHKRSTTRWFHPARGESVIDVGAHVGFFTVLAASQGATVLSLEPNPDTARILRENVRLNGLEGVTVVEAAAGESPERRPLFVPAVWDGRASLHPAWRGPPGSGGSREVPVHVEALDALTAPWHSGPIDWVLVDAEGWETSVLRGGPVTFARTRSVILEVSRPERVACRSLLEESYGFRIVASEPQTAGTEYWLATRD